MIVNGSQINAFTLPTEGEERLQLQRLELDFIKKAELKYFIKSVS